MYRGFRGETDDDVKDDTMRTYLNNTNLRSKRIVSATISVESHSQESELTEGVEKAIIVSLLRIFKILCLQEDILCLLTDIFLMAETLVRERGWIVEAGGCLPPGEVLGGPGGLHHHHLHWEGGENRDPGSAPQEVDSLI